MIYTEISDSIKEEIKEIASFLIVTATDIETKVLHCNMKPFPGYENIAKMYYENCTYYIGTFGAYGVVHVQCGGMGSIFRDASLSTTLAAIECWKPKAVVMIGIAFGVNKKKQRIGDVLISEAIIPYNIQRVGKKNKIYRNPIPPAGGVLLNRFKNFREWIHVLPCGETAKILPGQILSGESLVDNLEYRNELLDAFPAAVGGEMEGAGLFAAADNKKTEWIVVKGICDFADGSKSKNKRENQNIAANASVSLCLKLFSSSFAFKELGFIPVDPGNHNAKNIIEDPRLINNVLFNVYSKEAETYYIERQNDSDLQKLLNFGGLWLSGPSGCGKTCSISRNLIRAKKKYIYINLGCCLGYQVKELLNQIYLEIFENVCGEDNNFEPSSSLPRITKDLAGLLIKHFKNEEIYLFIEEIPLEDNKSFSEFVSKIVSVMMDIIDSNPILNIKFIFSSIQAAKNHIASSQKKICEKVKFLNFEYWKTADIKKLLEMILTQLAINFSAAEKQKITEGAKGSPRFIKMFTRNYICLHKNPTKTFEGIINETLDELD